MSETTDQTSTQVGQGENQLYVLKRGKIEITPSDFSGDSATKRTVITTVDPDTDTDILLNNFAVFHHVQDPASEFPANYQVDELIHKLNYDETGAAQTWMGFNILAASQGTEIVIYISYTAPNSSGTPYSSDETQNFYYIIYSQQPFILAETS